MVILKTEMEKFDSSFFDNLLSSLGEIIDTNEKFLLNVYNIDSNIEEKKHIKQMIYLGYNQFYFLEHIPLTALFSI